MALGVMADATFEQRAVQFEPGDLVLLYTDGITDAIDKRDRGFGVQQLQRMLVQAQNAPVADVVACIKRSLQTHVGDLAPFDDVTMIAVRRQ